MSNYEQSLQEALDAVTSHKSIRKAANFLGVARTTVHERYRHALERGFKPFEIRVKDEDRLESKNLEILQKENSDLRKALNETKKLNTTEEFVRETLRDILKAEPKPNNVKIRTSDSINHPGTPVLHLSDLHLYENIDARELNNINGFNIAVAEERLNSIVDTVINLWTRHLVHDQEYDGIYVFLGGDIISGIIHDELKATNNAEISIQVVGSADILWNALKTLEAKFKKIKVFCVPGNHGRSTMRPRFKKYNETNFDDIIYRILQKYAYLDGANISIDVNESRERLVEIEGTKFLLIHGDQFMGGDAMIGAKGTSTRGDIRLRDRATMLPPEFQYDILVHGHHHSASWEPNKITNGSLPGYSEYAAGKLCRFERPMQMAWTVHPRVGITWISPIYAPECKHLW
jgi:predicted phosphodiesterase